MNLLLLRRSEIDDESRVLLEGRRARHVIDVLHAEPGSTLRAAVLDEGPSRLEILAVGNGRVEGRLAASADAEDLDSRSGLRLVVALPRPKALRRLVQNAACLGVDRLDLVNAWRVQRSYFDSPHLDLASLEREAWLGAEQGARWRLPAIAVHRFLMPFLESLGEPFRDLRLLAHPHAERRLDAPLLDDAERPVTLAFGPEGGWIDREIDSFRDRGFLPCCLGPWILRTEIAVPVAVAMVDLLRSQASSRDALR